MSVRQFVILIFESEPSECEIISRFTARKNGSVLYRIVVPNCVSFDHQSCVISLPS